MKVLTLKEAAEIMAVPEKTARKVLKEVPCIDWGVGRGRGKRWLLQDVEDFIFKKRTQRRPVQPSPHLADMSSSEFVASLKYF